MKYIQVLIVLLFIGCSETKAISAAFTSATPITSPAIEEKAEDVCVYASKKKDVSGQLPPKEKDIRVYPINIKYADIKIPKTKYKDVMGFTKPKDIAMPDVGPR